MKSGLSMHFQNYADWDRFEAQERGEPVPGRPAKPDMEVWREELEIVDRAEDLGFESMWTVEHHFTPYTMSPNPLQFLTYVAGRTTTLDVGSMVVVLPWHNPLLIAEDMAMLQLFLGSGRSLRTGFGRGIARREYNSLGIPMEDSRKRFQESLDIIKLALTEDRFSYDGEIWKIPPTSLRPYPDDGQRLVDDMLGAWGSPESGPIMAENGLAPLIVPQRDLGLYTDEIEVYRKTLKDHGHEDRKPVVTLWAYCHESQEVAEEVMQRHVPQFTDSSVRHYELRGSHLKDIPGYEHYAERAATIQQSEHSAEFVASRMKEAIFGTPDSCLERLRRVLDILPVQEFAFHMKFGTMPLEASMKSIELFAAEVLPVVKQW